MGKMKLSFIDSELLYRGALIGGFDWIYNLFLRALETGITLSLW
jgi:hypothetical protein